MDDEEKAFSETPNDPYSLRLTEYLIGRIAALEKRIELLEKNRQVPPKAVTICSRSLYQDRTRWIKSLTYLLSGRQTFPSQAALRISAETLPFRKVINPSLRQKAQPRENRSLCLLTARI